MDMPIETALTARLGITHPILSAPMDVIAGARLVAAVSEAGGFSAAAMAREPGWSRRPRS
jgi:NAD(P)H-dependent flavin oxidoreductase YrpB (nitropropane dioxygenase family)